MDIHIPNAWLSVIILLIAINIFLSLAETSLIESHKSKLEKLADDGNKEAMHALRLLEKPDNACSVIQIGISLISILLGVFAAVLLTPFISHQLPNIPYKEIFSLVVSIIIVTYLTLMLSEFLPRRIAMQDPEHTLMNCQKSIRRIIFFTMPVTKFLSFSAKILLNLLGMKAKINGTVTEDEVKDLIEQGTEYGIFEKTEKAIVDRVFHMSDQKAYSIMTPRTQMEWIDLEDSPENNLKLIQQSTEYLIPVGNGSLDDFCGVIHTKDLLNASIDGCTLDLIQFIKKPLFVPRSMNILKVLEQIRKTGNPGAMVMDEFGGVVGFITLKDILLELIDGNSIDEPEPIHILPNSDGSWQIDGLCSIDDFKEKFDIDELPNEENDHYQTMGGFATSQIGYIPQEGEVFTWENFTFKILKLGRHRIDKMHCTWQKPPTVELEE